MKTETKGLELYKRMECEYDSAVEEAGKVPKEMFVPESLYREYKGKLVRMAKGLRFTTEVIKNLDVHLTFRDVVVRPTKDELLDAQEPTTT